MKDIKLTKGFVAWVDDADSSLVNGFSWFVFMHRLILGLTDSRLEVDHIDRNTLNNQRANLRTAIRSQNRANSRNAPRVMRGVRFKGVVWHPIRDTWVAQLTNKGKTYYLGSFVDPTEAAKAYDSAALKHFGEFARTNLMLGLL